MVFPQGRRVSVAALLILTAACSSTKPAEIDPYDAERIVTKRPDKVAVSREAEAVSKAARAEAALESAEVAWRAGDALGTLATVNRALIEGVPSEMEPAFRDLRAKARSSVVATKICRVRAIPERDVVADGTAIAVRIEFANLSNTTLRVPRAQKGSSAALVILKLVREDYDVYGNELSSEYNLSVPVESDLVLAPGQKQETPIVIPATMMKLTHEGFSVVRLEGKFRPVVMQVGESEFFDGIPIEPARVRIFLKGFEPLAADPLGSLKRAVEKRSPPHLLTCAELLAPSDRAEAKAFLEAAKEKDPPLGQAIDAALSRIAGAR